MVILWGKVLKQLNKKYTEDNCFASLKQALEYLYHIQNLNISQLATELGCSSYTLLRKMNELGIARRSRGGANNKLNWTMSKDEYEDMTAQELCLRYKTCLDVVRRRRREYEKGLSSEVVNDELLKKEIDKC